MKNISKTAGLAAAIVSLACVGSANADTITASFTGGAQAGATLQNFDSLTPGGNYSSATSLGGWLSVTITPNAGVYQNVGSGSPANPYFDGNSDVGFGGSFLASKAGDTTPYLTAGDTGHSGAITFSFTTAQNYLGLLWGSVDSGNELQFYYNGTLVDTITGAAVLTADSSLVEHDTYGNGDAYVNIDTTSAFNEVIATSSIYTFEIDNVAYGSSAPDAASSSILLLLGLGSLVLFRKNWNSQLISARNK